MEIAIGECQIQQKPQIVDPCHIEANAPDTGPGDTTEGSPMRLRGGVEPFCWVACFLLVALGFVAVNDRYMVRLEISLSW